MLLKHLLVKCVSRGDSTILELALLRASAFVHTRLYGILIAQAYVYMQNCRQDPKWMKYMVAFVVYGCEHLPQSVSPLITFLLDCWKLPSLYPPNGSNTCTQSLLSVIR